MSNSTQILMTGRRNKRLEHLKLTDHMFIDGLEDAYTDLAMGTFAQKTADKHQLTRDEIDVLSVESLRRALRAIENGLNEKEIGTSKSTQSCRRRVSGD